MKKLLSLLLCLVLTAALLPTAFASDDTRLSFRADGSFTILQLTDTQDDENPARQLHDYLALAIEQADPDLIVFTGDLVEDSRFGDALTDENPLKEGVVVKKINGDIDLDKTLANIKKATDDVLSVFEESGVPYVIALGNNDYKCEIGGKDWLDVFSVYPNNLTTDMSDDADGRVDCVLTVYDNSGAPAFNIWISDTGRGSVNSDQISWYTAKEKELEEEYGKRLPSFVFQHVPVAETGNLFEERSVFDTGAILSDGKCYRLKQGVSGTANTAMTPGETSAQFAAWKEAGDVIGSYFGHFHIDGYTGVYDGIELGLTYGSEFSKTSPYGFRKITLNENDILSYENSLYTYEGSAITGNLHFEKQENTEEKEIPVISALRNFFLVFVKLFKALLS